MGNYRLRYKKGDFEIEIESTDKSYVDSKFIELLDVKPVSSTSTSVKKKSSKSNKTSTNSSEESGQLEGEIDVSGVVNLINESDDHEAIDAHALSKAAQLPRVIMCMKFSSDLGAEFLTTGDIQKITDQLGVKLKHQNVGTCIKKNQKYFTADGVRKPGGTAVKYKLNRKGQAAYNKIIAGEKID